MANFMAIMGVIMAIIYLFMIIGMMIKDLTSDDNRCSLHYDDQ